MALKTYELINTTSEILTDEMHFISFDIVTIIIIIIIENCQKEVSLSTLCCAAAGKVGLGRFCEVSTLLMDVSLNLKVVHVGSCGEADQ